MLSEKRGGEEVELNMTSEVVHQGHDREVTSTDVISDNVIVAGLVLCLKSIQQFVNQLNNLDKILGTSIS